MQGKWNATDLDYFGRAVTGRDFHALFARWRRSAGDCAFLFDCFWAIASKR
jgi:hypothetical protein